MALSHIALQVALCNSALRRPIGTAFPLHVTVIDRINQRVVDKKFTVVRDNGNIAHASFDTQWGVYLLQIRLHGKGVNCGASEYYAVAPDSNRSIDVSLETHPVMHPTPLLVYGSAPFAYSYVQPTVVVFDKGLQCNQAVGNPLNMNIDMQNDSNGYYAEVYPSPQLVSHNVVVAIRLTDARGDYKYVRVPPKMMGVSSGWPDTTTFNVNENVIDYLADKPSDTLICPRLYTTITH